MQKNGFTLAEVLITLAIIGIVAALTIPSVISNYQQQEFKTGLKKAVSVLNEAIQTNIAQDGETPYETNDLFSYLQRHMSVIKSASGRRDGYLYGGNKFFYTTDGMAFEMLDPGGGGGYGDNIKLYETGVDLYNTRYMTDGSHVGFSGQCGSYGLANNPNNTKFPPCLVMVDVNGDKKPNPTISSTEYPAEYWANGDIMKSGYTVTNFEYKYPSPTDKKVNDIFNILITEEKAIPFGVVAQRAMYSK